MPGRRRARRGASTSGFHALRARRGDLRPIEDSGAPHPGRGYHAADRSADTIRRHWPAILEPCMAEPKTAVQGCYR